MPQLTPVHKAHILTLDDCGVHAVEIAQDLGVDQFTIQKHLKILRVTRDPTIRAVHPGRPQYFTPRGTHRAIRAIATGEAPDATALQRMSFPNTSPSTVRRELCRQGYSGRVRRHKPLLTEKHKKKRRAWADTHVT